MKLAPVSIPLHSPCPRCRKQVLPQAAFCPRCGVRLRAPQYAAPVARPIVATPFRAQIQMVGSRRTLEYATPRPKERPRRVPASNSGKVRWVAIFAGIMVVRFLASIGNQDSSSSLPPTITPLPRYIPPAPITVPHLSPPAVYTPSLPVPMSPRMDWRSRDGRSRSVDDPRSDPSQPRVYFYPPPRSPAR